MPRKILIANLILENYRPNARLINTIGVPKEIVNQLGDFPTKSSIHKLLLENNWTPPTKRGRIRKDGYIDLSYTKIIV